MDSNALITGNLMLEQRVAMLNLRAMGKTIPISKVTDDSHKATIEITKFKIQGTQGLVECKIKFIIISLLV